MAKPAPRVLVKINQPGRLPGLSAGDVLYFRDGKIERDSTADLFAEVIAAAWPLVKRKQLAFAAGDLSPVQGETASGVVFMVLPDDEIVDTPKTRRFERAALKAAADPTKQLPFLSRLPNSLLQSLRRVSKTLNCESGHVLIQEGTEAANLYMVDQGQVEVVQTRAQDEIILAILGEGDIFGEMSILTGDPTSATVRARGSCRILALDKETLEEMLVTQPLLGREFSRLLAGRIRMTRHINEELDRSIFGSLAMIDPSDLVQSMNSSRRTGRLTLTRGADKGDLYFKNGQLVGVTFRDLVGDEAMFEMLQWRQGKFSFEQGEFQTQGAIEGETMALLMNTMRLIDEHTNDSGPPE